MYIKLEKHNGNIVTDLCRKLERAWWGLVPDAVKVDTFSFLLSDSRAGQNLFSSHFSKLKKKSSFHQYYAVCTIQYIKLMKRKTYAMINSDI